MTTSDFDLLASFEREVDAEIVRGTLANHGIESYLEGVAFNQWLPLGAALLGVKLYVKNTDAAAARELLAAVEQTAQAPAEPWICRACHVEVNDSFDACWFCGVLRAGDGANEEIQWIEPTEIGDALESDDAIGRAEDRDHAIPLAEDESAQRETETDRLLRRAWIASILGVVLLPLIASVYSMYLLIYAAVADQPTTAIGNRRFYQALGINVLAFMTWMFLYFWKW